MAIGQYWLHTLGCPKNQVDSDKLAGLLGGRGLAPASAPGDADLVVVNTCAFIEAARQESIDAVLELAARRRPGARLVVTGCMAERYGAELAEALPEVDLVAGFGVDFEPIRAASPVSAPVALLGRRRPDTSVVEAGPPDAVLSLDRPPLDRPPLDRPPLDLPSFDLLELPRPAAGAPWAYVKVAEGCDRRCGFCAIPSFRGPQRSRRPDAVLQEVRSLVAGGGDRSGGGDGDGDRGAVREIVLVAQDLVSYGRDRIGGDPSDVAARRQGRWPIVELVRRVSDLVPRTRLLYVYPSGLTDELVEAMLSTGVPYFDLSLQHVSRRLLSSMARWGDGDRFLRRIKEIRESAPLATMRSSFIVGYPGETEEDHDQLLEFLGDADLDWAGFFPFSPEDGTPAIGMESPVPTELALERLRECSELQDSITVARRDRLVGETREVLVDAPGRGRTVHEAPEIDGIVHVPHHLPVGALRDVVITESLGTDLVGRPAEPGNRA